VSAQRTVVAWATAAAVVLGAPVVGDLRNALLLATPRYYVLVISAGVIAGAVAVLVACFRAIREDRARRVGILASSVALALVSFAALRSGNANVDAVEAFHFVEYAVLALLFFPFGQVGARWEAYLQAGLATTAVGIADEWFQWFVPGRAGEWRDVLFDVVATVCGLLLCLALDTRAGLTTGSSVRGGRLGLATAAVVLLLGAFLATLHLGHAIHDPQIGVFRSRFSDARLQELGAERRREWGGGPPPVRGRYDREDQYEAEALWHVRRRNFGMDKDRNGDPAELDIAWRENQILERHFTAVLDAGHRLAPEQLADVDGRRAHGTAPFESDAEALPIYTWSPVVFWAIVGGLAAVATVAGAVLDRSRKMEQLRVRRGEPSGWP
jgi:hypothetical protein